MFNSKMIGANAVGLPPQPPGTGALVSTSDVGMVISVDDGLTWSQEGIVHTFPQNPTYVSWTGSTFVCNAGNTLHYSADGYNWTQTITLPGTSVGGITSNGSYTLVGNFTSGTYMYMHKSTDGGLTWSSVFGGNNNIGITSLREGGINAWGHSVWSWNNGSMISTNGSGTSWGYNFNSNGSGCAVGWSPYSPKWIGTSSRDGGYRSAAGGPFAPTYMSSWAVQTGIASPLSASFDKIVSNVNGQTMLFRTTASSKVYRTTNGGSLFQSIPYFTSYPTSQFAFHNSKFICYYNGNIVGSTNGYSWSTISTPTGYTFYRMASMGKLNY